MISVLRANARLSHPPSVSCTLCIRSCGIWRGAERLQPSTGDIYCGNMMDEYLHVPSTGILAPPRGPPSHSLSMIRYHTKQYNIIRRQKSHLIGRFVGLNPRASDPAPQTGNHGSDRYQVRDTQRDDHFRGHAGNSRRYDGNDGDNHLAEGACSRGCGCC